MNFKSMTRDDKMNFDILYEKIIEDVFEGKHPYEMSRPEFENWLGGKCPIEVTGEWIKEKTGIADPVKLLDYYKNKYKDRLKGNNIILELEDTSPEEFTRKHHATDKAAGLTWRDEAGFHINIPTRDETENQILGVLRHELEHVFDQIEGFDTDKPSVQPGELKVGEEGLEGKEKFKGHHHHYEWFDIDYLRRSIVRDAMEKGLPVPEEVKKDYPGI